MTVAAVVVSDMDGATIRSVLHPVDDLTGEHRVIEAVLDAMVAVVRDLRNGEALSASWWLRTAEFLEEYADACHHGKEEDLLFPALVAHGVADQGGPVGVMKHEHVRGRERKQAIRAAAEAGDVEALMHNAGLFVGLLREHIQKEDHCLFQMARAHLPDGVVRDLRGAFDRFAAEHDASRYVELARELCRDAGVSFDVAVTGS